MSIDRCKGCDGLVDIDADPDSIVADPRHSLAGHPDIVICKACREHEQEERERAP